MTKVYLEHNPFSGKTVCEINGTVSILQKCWGDEGMLSRLQDWVEHFFDELDTLENDDDYEVEFFGLPSDCKDISTACSDFLNRYPNKSIELKLKEGKSSEHRIKDLRILFEDMQRNSPYEELKTEEIRYNFEHALSTTEDIGVVATMSSGKSTLINAMLGQELLPARNEATTAIVAKIHNNDSQKTFSVKAYDNDGQLIEDSNTATLSILEKLNSNKNLSVIELYGDIPNIDEFGMDVVLNDTPGPNNSATDEHKAHTYSLLNSDFKPMILYVFNATQLRTNDDNTLLNDVSKKINMPGTQSKDRFLFVLNKADTLDPGKGETVEKAISDLTEYLSEHNIREPQIFPVSAQLAKVIRMKKNNLHLSEDEEDFLDSKVKRIIKNENRQFSRLAPLSFSGKKKQEELIKYAQEKGDDEALADVYSGVPAVEIAINEYIEKYAISAKVKKAVESFDHIIDRLAVKSKSTKNLEHNKAERDKVIEALKIIESKLKKGQEGQAYREKIDNLSISDKLDEELKIIRKDLLTQMVDKSKKNQIDINVARGRIENFKLRLEQYSPKLKSDIEKAIQDSVIDTARKIILDYKSHVSDLLTVGEFNSDSVSISAMITSTINEDALMNKFTETKEIKVGTRTVKNQDKKWYKPWTWFQSSYYEQDVYEEREFVDYEKIHDEIVGDILEQFDSQLDDIQQVAISQVDDFKSFFKKELKKLDKMMEEEIVKQKQMLSDEKKFESEVKKEEMRLHWIEDFNNKLKTVLSI
ncbi:hypothetical protein E4N85_07675 [Treponema denticola]|uniref:dynamin family protein n=1 Tax=Treponema denticola TaxID=158 RepID=UPI0020A43033|nr:dynamin family protein [Treponema denticola]UTC95610.1 hypothetical protein E4N85_07675 [Treponema denticola]